MKKKKRSKIFFSTMGVFYFELWDDNDENDSDHYYLILIYLLGKLFCGKNPLLFIYSSIFIAKTCIISSDSVYRKKSARNEPRRCSSYSYVRIKLASIAFYFEYETRNLKKRFIYRNCFFYSAFLFVM